MKSNPAKMWSNIGLQHSSYFRRGQEQLVRKDHTGPESIPSPSGPIQANSNKLEEYPFVLQDEDTDNSINGTVVTDIEAPHGNGLPDEHPKLRLVAPTAVLAFLVGSATTAAAVWGIQYSDAILGTASHAQHSKASLGSSSHGSDAKRNLAHKQRNCMAHSEFHCLLNPGCRWFSFLGSSGANGSICPNCQKWFGPRQAKVTGCRDWDPRTYCHDNIFTVASKDSDPRAPWFSDALGQYQVTQSGMERSSPRKKLVCDVWCDGPEPGRCSGQPRVTGGGMHGVNYGGRFIPDQFLGLNGTEEILFKGIVQPDTEKKLSLCDVSKSDSSMRMTRFLDLNIKEEHFALMAKLGFRIVRLPLGYWNVIEVPGGGTPTGPPEVQARWRALQSILPVPKYRAWIDKVFAFALNYGLKVLMDLHGAPGGQSGSQKTGCGISKYSIHHFPSDPAGVGWNTELGVMAIESMARICADHGETCYGIELLNEPIDPGLGKHTRHHLQSFYHRAILSARKHLDKDKPLVIFEWAPRMWYWRHRRNWFTYENYGHIMFSTHLLMYPNPTTVLQKEARESFNRDIYAVREFALHTGYDVLVTEYALNSHGDGKNDDHFDYNSLTDWFIHQFEQFALGTMIWNFDSFYPAWGPVEQTQIGSGKAVDWKAILRDRCRWKKSNCTREPWQFDDATNF